MCRRFRMFQLSKSRTFEAGVNGADSHLSHNCGVEGGAPVLTFFPYFKSSNLEGGDPQRGAFYISCGIRRLGGIWEKQGLTEKSGGRK